MDILWIILTIIGSWIIPYIFWGLVVNLISVIGDRIEKIREKDN